MITHHLKLREERRTLQMSPESETRWPTWEGTLRRDTDVSSCLRRVVGNGIVKGHVEHGSIVAELNEKYMVVGDRRPS